MHPHITAGPKMSQDFSEKGRIEWAIRTFGEGKAALEREDLDTAIAILKESITAFPFPQSLELLGECLLLKNKPAEATLYFAAAIGIAKDYQFKSLFLLGKALAAANDTFVSKIKLEHALSINTDQEAALSVQIQYQRIIPARRMIRWCARARIYL
jgi:tetratricopeptide (TPR) repeat protein